MNMSPHKGAVMLCEDLKLQHILRLKNNVFLKRKNEYKYNEIVID